MTQSVQHSRLQCQQLSGFQLKQITVLSLLLLLTAMPASAQWQQQTIKTTADFRGLSVVSKEIAWVSGTKGTIGRTLDGGQSWEVLTIPGAEKLDFRDIEAFSETTACVLSIGPGEKSRIYKTIDGGKSWLLQFTNTDADAFFDAIAFWDENHGIAMSDPVKGFYRLIVTDDGGASWKPLSPAKMPPALPNEGAFAASGTCLITQGTKDAWFVTGGSKVARVFHTTDRGMTWTAADTPILAGKESAGIFSIAFKNANEGMIVGGDYQKPGESNKTAATTQDGGKTWGLKEKAFPFASCVIWAQDRWVTVGTKGSWQSDDGISWKQLDQENYNVVAGKAGSIWAAGPQGRIARYVPIR